MALAKTYSREELLRARQELLDDLGYSVAELERRSAAYTLTESERAAWETIKNIDYLLQDDI